jgi:hypothetical protein
MTEAEWLTSTDPESMLSYHLRGVTSDRRLRLFAVACCRRIWHLFSDPRSRTAVEVAEKYADGSATEVELDRAYEEADGAHKAAFAAKGKGAACLEWAAQFAADRVAFFAARRASGFARRWTENGGAAQADLLREMVMNEFRPVTVDPLWLAWNDAAIPRLAGGIYHDRAFDRLPVLADALEDAGCDNADMLAHCRGPGPHVRGCWVVDLLLGKS